MVDVNDNKLIEEVRHPEYEFKFNFINTPWDDRSTKSKLGIISLLVAIFVATMAMIAHNFYMHYTRTSSGRRGIDNEIKCHLVKADEHRFAARIHSIETQELLCVGALVSYTSVLANGVCTKSGPVRLRLGSSSNSKGYHRNRNACRTYVLTVDSTTPSFTFGLLADPIRSIAGFDHINSKIAGVLDRLCSPLCKKGFAVRSVDPIQHDGTISKLLVVLTTYESMSDCGDIIKIGNALDIEATAYIIGRPLSTGKLLSRQPAKLLNKDVKTPGRKLVLEKTICVTDLAKCPVKAGDLLIQNGLVYGLASTSIHITDTSRSACFADLRLVREELNL